MNKDSSMNESNASYNRVKKKNSFNIKFNHI